MRRLYTKTNVYYYVPTILDPGTYYAELDGQGNESSRYLLYIEALSKTGEVPYDPYEPDNTPDQAKTIRYCSDCFSDTDAFRKGQSRLIFPTDDVDWVKFTLSNTANIRLSTYPPHRPHWQLIYYYDTRLWLYDSNLNQIAFNDDRGGDYSRCSFIESKLPPGTYYAKVDEDGNDREIFYQLLLQATQEQDQYEPDNTPDQAGPIQLGSEQEHSIIPRDDVDWVKFTVAEPSDIVLETSGFAGDTRLWLYDGNLKPIAFNDDIVVGRNLSSRITRRGLAPGTYYAKVDEYWNDEETHLNEHEIDRYRLSLKEMQETDYEPDGDVDGSDLYHLIIGNLTLTIEEFAMNYGEIYYP
ncbi:hypothetical protein D1AOALGA4SA_10676 [Olavius algarvensis Delta 1 endosymbiont]|nr:hypothetical protein D1AOALGA4SA_10676 [Olavius algarvensis Delta 1 endosymbiont]